MEEEETVWVERGIRRVFGGCDCEVAVELVIENGNRGRQPPTMFRP
jgi:hypothetical protein